MTKFKQQKYQKIKNKKKDSESYSRINPYPKYDW